MTENNKQTTATPYYVTVVFDLPSKSESRFNHYVSESGFLIEHPLSHGIALSL